MIRLIAMIAAALALVGCATSPESVKALADAQVRMITPTMIIKCAQGCEASYTDPRDRAKLTLPTNGWDAVALIGGSVERVITGAVLPAAAVAAIREVRKAGEGGNTSTTTTTTTTHTASGAGASTGGDAHYEQVGPDSNNTTSSDTSTTTTTDSHDATAAPTVVTQPPAQIVRPEVVTPIIWTPIP